MKEYGSLTHILLGTYEDVKLWIIPFGGLCAYELRVVIGVVEILFIEIIFTKVYEIRKKRISLIIYTKTYSWFGNYSHFGVP